MPAARRLATASVNVSTAVARSPAAHAARPMKPAAAPRGKWSSGPASASARRACATRAVDVAPGLGDRGAVDRDHRRQGAELALPVLGGLGERRPRGRAGGAVARPASAASSHASTPSKSPSESRLHPMRWRAAAGGGRRRRAARPASREGCGPGVAGAGSASASSTRSAVRSWSPLAIACRTASTSSPCSASQRPAAACSSPTRSACRHQSGTQRVGEQVVVAVPAALVVERDDEVKSRGVVFGLRVTLRCC